LKRESLSRDDARALALAATGFERGGKEPNQAALERVIAATQLFQIDSVSVVARAHYLPLF
jgi:uncharacterized protein YcaQ